MKIEFFVAGVPKTLSVGGSVRWKSKDGRSGTFQTKRNTDWSDAVASIARENAPPDPWDGVGVELTLLFYVPRPKSAKKSVTLPLARPDLDNLFHKLTDRMNGVFWRDDSIVTDFVARKRFPADGRTGLLVTIAPADGGTLF